MAVVPRLGRFADTHPDIEIRTVASEGLANFCTDGVDLAIRQGSPPFGTGLRVEPLAPLALRAVCSPELAGSVGPMARLADFCSQPLVADAHNLWDALFEEAGVRASRRVTRFNQTALAMDAAANGQGIALAPGPLVEADIASGRLVELWRDTQPERGGFFVVCRDGAAAAPARDAVIAWLLAEVAGGADGDPPA